MNKISIFVLALLVLLLTNCGEYGVELRLENRSELNFDHISVNNVSFGPLESKAISAYVPFEDIYDKELVQIQIGENQLKLIPKSFDEDAYRSSGKFRYIIDIDTNNRINIERKSE